MLILAQNFCAIPWEFEIAFATRATQFQPPQNRFLAVFHIIPTDIK